MSTIYTSYQLSERFEVAFNQIHDSLKSIVKIPDDRFKVLLDVGSRKHQIIREFYDDLKQYAKLRNSLVHDKKQLGFYIAEPHINVVKQIEKNAAIFSRPNFALSIATKEVITVGYEDDLIYTFQTIKRYGFSQYPVYKGKECVGLLNTGDIVRWVTENVTTTIVDLSGIKVKDVLSRVHHHPIDFVAKSIDIFSIEDIFEEKHKKKLDLEAVIITENGKNDEIPLGLVTAWDLIEIDYTID
ncbi:CBS domain-containing protein [Fredinandcohnia sp. FSL W7-1320]|uniref:CBS domain-containing protein n=1 Tax=Fredinandcohnia sp. FSL W7-1320 TaxID=2954540 RepID=UPI0030FD9F4D